jgi:hypothetical protein
VRTPPSLPDAVAVAFPTVVTVTVRVTTIDIIIVVALPVAALGYDIGATDQAKPTYRWWWCGGAAFNEHERRLPSK